MTTAAHEFTRYADIGTALADPRLVPLPAEPSAWRPTGPGDTSGGTGGEGRIAGGGATGGDDAAGAMAWLRATVARFSSGEAHARRRALVEADCARLDPAALRLARRLGKEPFLVSVDVEGGFSDDPSEVAELAGELAAAGVAGINLEDGRADGSLAPVALHAAKITAVKAAAPGLFVNARTDTHWLGGHERETTGRLDAYQQAGADGVFVPGLADPEIIADLVRHLGVPLNVLHSPTGPAFPQLADLGVARVSLGSLLYRLALGAATAAALAVRAGRPATGPDTPLPSYAEVQRLVR
ncbi:hypothetical protein GCM10010495_44120 [Kitasatospora herbaricolor]|uniref:isocitrate lyase/phosphoenolpyruvate mutase family protein n=1 Tax=Kitasatospora herbaricolor TaxID=68217 RepID=UPI00198B0C5C|nr:isocitrate lyase/phosphoenolpyruvate mutase family protein [Kitasatospora herbaricolor]MDQ0306044.1 2-methylisocitrate lyase-like PEP mutase family enzyme [Kitasatospora herbaricolor]GGV23703.1 hypothetical protein GCM10010495_44120 [Kitasatospora herbaricolor]